MNTARKRILSLALAVCLLLGMTLAVPGPVVVSANVGIADGRPPNTDIEAYKTVIGFAGQEWYVVGYNDTGVEPDEDDYVILLLKTGQGSETRPYTNSDFGTNHVYNGRTLHIAMQGIYDNSTNGLSQEARERALVVERELDGVNNTIYAGGNDTLPSKQTIWPLSLAEYDTVWSDTEESGNSALLAYSDAWWLRSPHDFGDLNAFVGSASGGSSVVGSVDFSRAVRPAFQLNLESVIFTSDAAGGKSDLSVADGLVDATTVSGNAIKLTVEDDGQELEDVVLESGNGTNELTFSYTSATTGENQYISCILEDGGIKYYGKLEDTEHGSSGQMTVPLNAVTDGTYTLKIFSEQANDDYHTDFAGGFHEFEITVTSGKGEMVSNNAYLKSVAEQPIDASADIGDRDNPKTATISLDKTVEKIEITDIIPTDSNATVNLYSDDGFTQDVSEISLTAGQETDLYIKVIAEDGITTLYYNITTKRGELPTLQMTEHKTTLQVGNETNGTEVATAQAEHFSGTVSFSIDGTQLPQGFDIDSNGKMTVTNADALVETAKTTYTVKAVHGTEEATATIDITILAADAPPPPPDTPEGPKVYEDTLTITTGDTATFQISLGHSGNKAATADIASDDENIATATPTQITPDMADTVTVKGESKGNATITVTFSGGDLATPTEVTVKVTVQDSSGGNPNEPDEPDEPDGPDEPDEPDKPDEPKPPVTDPDGGGNGGSGGSSSSRSRSSSSGNRSTPDRQVAKAQLPASAFKWEGRTLTIDHDSVSVLGLLSVQWDGQTLTRGTDYGVYQGSVIVRFGEDFIAAQSPGNHTVQVEFLNHTGEATVTVGETGLTTDEPNDDLFISDTHNPNTGGYPDGSYPATDNPDTGDGRGVWFALLLGSIGAAALVKLRPRLEVK